MRVLVVDDDRLVCQSLKTILQASGEVEVVGAGHGGREAVSLYTQLRPDVLLMDIRMEGMTGLEAMKEVLALFPEARVLFLTTFLDDEYIVQALRLGAKGYILKQDFESILPALTAVHSGQSVFGDAIVTKLPSLLKRGAGGAGGAAGSGSPASSGETDAGDGRAPGAAARDLAARGITDKERSIIELVAKGLSNREIAERLYLGEGTVRNYLSTILDKLGLRDRTQLAVFYLRRP